MSLINREDLIAELNNSHFPGAPYVDAGISIAIGKVCDAPTIEPEPKWIPCSERLPEKEGDYLVTDNAGGVLTISVDTFCFCYDGEPVWLCSQNVTAWMPLPEPYREEGEQNR